MPFEFHFSPLCLSQAVTHPLLLLAVPLRCPTATIPSKVAAIQVRVHHRQTAPHATLSKITALSKL